MRTTRALSFLLAGLLTSTTTWAQTSGSRVFGEIQDENGQPIPDVKITITTPEITTFKIETSSDSKGTFKVSVVDATKTYHWRFEKPGYVTSEADLKVGIRQNERRNVKLLSVAAAQAASAGAPDPAVTAFNEGVEAYSQGDTRTALQKFEAAIAANPQLAAAHAAASRIHAEEKRFAEAAAAAERALAIEPANTAALRVAVAAYTELGDQPKLAAAQQALAAADPKVAAGALYVDGVKLFNEGKTEEAAATLEKAVAANPDHAKSHYILGLCYSGMGDSAKAKEHLQTFLRLAPNDEDAAAAQEMLGYL